MIGIIDYGMGNLRSLSHALDHIGADVTIVSDPAAVADLTHVIVPGVGAFGKAMANLTSRGFVDPIKAHVAAKKPLLGICLGMQMLATKSLEFGEHRGLDLVPGHVEPFTPSAEFPVPHVGWNTFEVAGKHPFFRRTLRNVDYYFVHSFHFVTREPGDSLAISDYGRRFTSVVARGNVVGCQFHPEKSQTGGLSLLEDFMDWDGAC